MRWGNTDLYKFGYTSNISQRLKSINNTGNIINKFDENYHLFHCIFKKEFKTEKEAYVFEQNVFNEVSLNLCEHIDGEFYKIEFEKLKEVFSPFQIIF
jgi:predicted GIY-YIG superfamily endonuclease